METKRRVQYQLLSYDLDNYTGKFRFRSIAPTKTKWNTVNLKLSGLLRSWIANGRLNENLPIGYDVKSLFESDLEGGEFAENPFKLIVRHPTGKSDIPLNYKLELVNQINAKEEDTFTFEDVFGDKYKRYKYVQMIFKSSKFLRKTDVFTEAMLKDIDYQIVEP